ncbi:MAG: hypothetical protein O7D91_14385, partial [Planctomycetota bacterium]|nr:hypothetical protein [Planctomycetota bacterium]
MNDAVPDALVSGYEPSLGDTFEVITAPSLSGQFDVVFLPALPGGLFMRVEYDIGSPFVGAGGSVTLIVDSLGELFEGFDDPESVGIPG